LFFLFIIYSISIFSNYFFVSVIHLFIHF